MIFIFHKEGMARKRAMFSWVHAQADHDADQKGHKQAQNNRHGGDTCGRRRMIKWWLVVIVMIGVHLGDR